MDRNLLEHTLHDYVCLKLETYLQNLGGQTPTKLYPMVMIEVESALFKTVLKHCQYNQSKAAQYLGMSRGTLRKKLKSLNLESLGK